MKATIEDVARRAQVSAATVSRALRGLPNVAPGTRERVMLAARELEYVGDPSASRLAGGPTRTLGLVVPTLGQWYYSRLFSGAEAAASDAGYDVLPFSTAGPTGSGPFLERLPFHKRVDALAVIDLPLGDDELARLLASGVPVVTLGVDTSLVRGIVVDNVAAARLGVSHLARLGHRRVAMLGARPQGEQRSLVAGGRFEGYSSALAAIGLDVEPRLVVDAAPSLLGGAEAMHTLLAMDDPPTAVFACTDEMAIGALQVARDAGFSVPDDLSLLGFDDHDVAEYLGLTTIRQDVGGQGERIVRLLLDALGTGDVEPLIDVHPTRLMVRRTTAPPLGGAGYRW